MQRRETQGRRQGAERDAAQPITGQPRSGDDEDHPEEPERVPSFLSARELQARDPAAQASDKEPEDGGGDDASQDEERAGSIQRRGPRHKS